MKFFLAILSFLLALTPVAAQEIECTVTTNVEALAGDARENLNDFISQVQQYINSYRWTSVDLGGEKIKCTMDIQFKGSPRDGHYSVQAFIGSQRPIFQSGGSSTALVRLKDDNWEFDYIRSTPFIHNDDRFDPLMSFIDFYTYIILGYDFDSYKAGDGTPYFQKALEIANKARGSGNAGVGWEATSQNTYSRGLLVDELLNARFYDCREAFYKYHYRGLDLLAKDDVRARKNMLAALEKIGQLQDRINQRTQMIKLFFETKHLEIAQTFAKDPDLTVFTRIIRIDPAHQSDYEKASRGEN
ncbi:MAG: DUF4835 family protein [Ignavibacteriae bacterium]|nr:DUF4835 family protein [Ignavibacteria bacterium]MBI3363551.1 DUF4835 family protein [Ignavibacteriota bacterium]